MRATASARLVVFCACIGVLGGCLAYPPYTPRKVSDDVSLLYTEHRRDDGYFNPWLPFVPSFKRRLQFMLTANPYPKRDPVVPRVENDGQYLADAGAAPSVTWVGHATVAIHERGQTVLTDPHFGPRVWTAPRHHPAGLPIESIPANAAAVVSHNHPDHLDAATVEKLPASVLWLVPLGVADWMAKRGRHNVIELDWWQSHERDGWTFTCLPSQHWSQRLGVPFNATLWCSWLIDSPERRYYFAGDTGYFHGFAEFGRKFSDIDVAILPIGAYAPRDFISYQHVDPQDAFRAYQDLGARVMLPVHWGTFRLSHEPIDEGPRELKRLVVDKDVDPSRVRWLAIGERWVH